MRKVTPSELEEIAEIEDELRELTTSTRQRSSVIALAAGEFLRRDRLFRDLVEHGVTRGRAAATQPTGSFCVGSSGRNAAMFCRNDAAAVIPAARTKKPNASQ